MDATAQARIAPQVFISLMVKLVASVRHWEYGRRVLVYLLKRASHTRERMDARKVLMQTPHPTHQPCCDTPVGPTRVVVIAPADGF